ncbi:MAG: MBL fold metallo-hydrolase [Candidatus Micrarchaeota archaeon]|nr:MBL fold metallo-hydrolase [Candidatus Micrarchaeota archaeon]
MKIRWLGHDTFLIEAGGKVIYIDPYVLPVNSPLADIILVTHEHFDHLNKEKIGEIRKPDTIFVCNKSVASQLEGDKHVLEYFEKTDVGNITVECVPAYNPVKKYHPKGFGCGFVLEADGKRVYHAGDTDLIPEMEKLENVDVALLPIGGTYTMNIDEAIDAALIIRPRIVVPMHYGTLEGLDADPEEFKEKIESQSSIIVDLAKDKPLEL